MWHFEIFVNAGSHGARSFKILLRQFSSDLSQTLLGHWLLWWNTGYCFLGNGPVF